MEQYPKINAPFKRYLEGPNKGKLIMGDWCVPELEYLADCDFEFTEKVDGTNIRIYWDGVSKVSFAGRTDKAIIPTPLLMALEDLIDWPVVMGENGYFTAMTLYGEGYGDKIQSGGKYRSDTSFVIFDIKIDNWWLQRKDVEDIAKNLGIDAVPVIGQGTLQKAIEMVKWGTDPRYDYLVSQWGEFPAEGIVARPSVPLFDRAGKRIIVKIKGKDFK